jgi:hypothetical protein
MLDEVHHSVKLIHQNSHPIDNSLQVIPSYLLFYMQPNFLCKQYKIYHLLILIL